MYALPETNLKSSDRILELLPMEGKSPTDYRGQVDSRLFTGEQKLHVKMDPTTTLWYFQWDTNGVIPGGLQGRFTGFKSALRHAEDYFAKRNVRVVKVIE